MHGATEITADFPLRD